MYNFVKFAKSNKEKRNKEIVRLFCEDFKTQNEIAKIMNLTRERVRQILNNELTKKEWSKETIRTMTEYNFNKHIKTQRWKIKEKLAKNKCIVCGEPRYRNRFFCSQKCFSDNPANETSEERRIKGIKATKRWLENMKKDPEKYNLYIRRIKEYNKEYAKRPEVKEKARKWRKDNSEKINEYQKRVYHKIKNDPEYRIRLKEYRKKYYRKKVTHSL